MYRSVPIYALPTEDIVNYIESPQPKSQKRRRNKKKTSQLLKSQTGAGGEVSPLKLLDGSAFTPDSSADRMTATQHSKLGETPNKEEGFKGSRCVVWFNICRG